MRRRVGLVALSLTALALFAGAHAPPDSALRSGPRALLEPPARAASVTEPPEVSAISVPGLLEGHGGGWVTTPADRSVLVEHALADDVLAAYYRAVAVAPVGCHLPVTLLMAIGQ